MRMKESGLEVGGGVCLLSSLEQPHPERSSGSQGLDWDCRQVPRKSSRGGIRVSLMVRTKMTRARVMATGRRREGLEATGYYSWVIGVVASCSLLSVRVSEAGTSRVN